MDEPKNVARGGGQIRRHRKVLKEWDLRPLLSELP